MTDFSAYQGTWTIDPSHSRLGFVARHAMVTKVRGQFDEYAGTLVVDAANPSASTASVTVQLASVNTASPDRDAHLRSADFFDVENNKEMTFASTGVKQDGDEFTMLGDLTIKGVTKPVTLKVNHYVAMPHPMLKKDAIGADASVVVKRTDFNAGKYAPHVGDDVTITISLEAIKG